MRKVSKNRFVVNGARRRNATRTVRYECANPHDDGDEKNLYALGAVHQSEASECSATTAGGVRRELPGGNKGEVGTGRAFE